MPPAYFLNALSSPFGAKKQTPEGVSLFCCGAVVYNIEESRQPYRLPSFFHGLSHGLKICHRHIFLTAFRVPSFLYNIKRVIPNGITLLMVRRKGLEPLTYWFVASHSIQLSYRRIALKRLSILAQLKEKSKSFFEKRINFFQRLIC